MAHHHHVPPPVQAHHHHHHPGQFQQPPPPPQVGLPPQMNFQQPVRPPPQGGFPSQGPFPPQNGFQQGPPPPGQFQNGWGQQPQGYGPPAFPSPGYDIQAPLPVGDASRDADALRAAMKGLGTDEKQLIRVLSKPDPNQMRLLVQTYKQRQNRDLERDLHKETSGYFRDGLLALVRGPLMQDVHLVHEGIKGLGTKESFLNDVLCGRSNADMHAIKQLYHQTYHQPLEKDVKADLSMKTEKLFAMILSASRAEESTPYNPVAIEADAVELHRAMGARVGTDQLTVSSILSSRSDNQLRGIASFYQQKYQESLQDRIRKEFSGHMQQALLLMLGRATDPAMTSAEQLEATMKGLGTKDELLVQRVVKCHWDRTACDQVKRAYRHKYKADLITRVKGEVRGDVERLLVACLE